VSLRSFIVLLAAVAGALATARLGFWQLDRAAQKTALHEALLVRSALPALDAAQLARTPEAAVEQQHRRVVLEGRWSAAHSVYLDNRQMNGRPGFFVVTPLQIAPDDVVLVQRGWVPRDSRVRERLVAVDTPVGVVRIEGRVEMVEPELSDAYYASRPLDSRIGAWASPQSQVIASRTVLVTQAAKFGLKYAMHPPRPPHWGGYRLLPDAWEFWQGRKSRLHDRLRYRLQAESWVRERLAP